MTFTGGQQQLVDPEASLRAELTGAIAAAQIDIANAIAELARTGADSAALANHGQAVQQLHRTVGSANLGSLLALRHDVASAATSATTLANQTISTATNTATAQAHQSPAERARQTLQSIATDLFDNKVLDSYLQFDSAEDEEEYRKREREREAEVKRQLALGTPEGVRRANELIQDQLRDADAHGASRSPDFAGMTQRADAAMTDLLPATPDRRAADESAVANATGSEAVTQTDDGLGDIFAALKAAGVTTPAIQASDAGHGVRLAVAQGRDSAAIGQG
jgi:hypothetical protein